jgi:threonine dehydrogenase-like Zn-dependent dehydrogenase
VEALGGSVGIKGRYDVVFDAVGSQTAIDTAVKSCETGGSIVELGVFWDAVSLRQDVTLREISLLPSVFYAHGHDDSDFTTAIEVISAAPHIEDVLVTHRFALDEASRAFEVAADRASGALKVHLVV